VDHHVMWIGSDAAHRRQSSLKKFLQKSFGVSGDPGRSVKRPAVATR
jgi:hypothetical protein